MPVRLYLLLPLAITLASLHALPLLPRPDRLFGVAVPREIRYGSEGRRPLRRYELKLLPWTAAAFFGSVWLPLSWAVLWIPVASLMPLTVASWIFSRCRIEVRHFALPAPSTRQARLTDADDRLFLSVLTFVISLAILVGTGFYLHVHWDEIPARFPIHWGRNGTPNGWSTRSIAGVYGPLIFGAIIVLFIRGILALATWGSRRSARHPAGQIVPIVVTYVIATVFSLVGLLPVHIAPMRELMALHGASVSILAIVVWLSFRRPAETGTEAGEITPEACWHGDQFYYNAHDPALFVEKRIGVGLTLNFGNRLSWIVLALILLISGGLVFLAFEFTKG